MKEPQETLLAFRVHSNLAELAKMEAAKRDQPVSEVCRTALLDHLLRKPMRVRHGRKEAAHG